MELAKRSFFAIEDFVFEKRNHLTLSGIENVKELDSHNLDSIQHANHSQQVWCRNIRELFKQAQLTGTHFKSFIDIGSGKGKACLYISSKKQIEDVIGIELLPPLVVIANQNKARLGAHNVAFINADAKSFTLPSNDSIVFLFNPFDEVVLESFISHNILHFRNHKSVIAYANDVHRQSLVKFGFFPIYENHTRKISVWAYLTSI
jgi:precorrin-6B methylase 2